MRALATARASGRFDPRRRATLLRLAAAGAVVVAGAAAVRRPAWAADEHVVEITAKRFNYTPNEVVVPAGVPITLAFTSIDFIHGFNLPDLHLRADLVPGRVTRVPLGPLQAGTLDFLCDNFCGDGHEGMSGKLIVKA